jgi:ketosteroid isomerase-like protein
MARASAEHLKTSSEAAGLVLEAFDAVERRDRDRLVALYHPEVEFHWPPSLVEAWAGRNWEEVWDPFQPTPQERAMRPRLVAASEREVVVLWRQRGLAPNGDRFEGDVLGLYEVRDHKFARAQMFYFDAVAVRRFLRRASRAQAVAR